MESHGELQHVAAVVVAVVASVVVGVVVTLVEVVVVVVVAAVVVGGEGRGGKAAVAVHTADGQNPALPIIRNMP